MPSEPDFYSGAHRTNSPFCDKRPEDATVSLLVIHNMSLPPGQFGGADIAALFTGTLNPDKHPFFKQIAHLRVSAHCVIYRDGKVEQFVPFSQRAWHAGVSSFQGKARCNDFAIGIELEGTDDLPFTDAQYTSLASVSQAIMLQFPAISIGRIVGHSDIAPGRKTDPGPYFDWCRYRQQLFPCPLNPGKEPL